MMESGFPQFPHLSPELRHAVWKAAVPAETRVFELGGVVDLKETVPVSWSLFSFARKLQDEGLETVSLRRYKFKYAYPVPAILHTCSESRYIARKSYFLLFGRLWFNPGLDMIYFSSAEQYRVFDPTPRNPPAHVRDLDRVRHIGVAFSMLGIIRPRGRHGPRFLAVTHFMTFLRMYFQNLESINVITPAWEPTLLKWIYREPYDYGMLKPILRTRNEDDEFVFQCPSWSQNPNEPPRYFSMSVHEFRQLWDNGAYFLEMHNRPANSLPGDALLEDWKTWSRDRGTPDIALRFSVMERENTPSRIMVRYRNDELTIDAASSGEEEERARQGAEDEWVATKLRSRDIFQLNASQVVRQDNEDELVRLGHRADGETSDVPEASPLPAMT